MKGLEMFECIKGNTILTKEFIKETRWEYDQGLGGHGSL